ncbi:hypothetical protein [Paenibacillus methanolicus]|uniref:Beta-galactosidase n=1 Tax=Paenibacillus methanolicus TaxID=582686 RepID=A0A5S5CDD9_9BACL|nr:hypothetical protein [Paenibacillus methanolicus]TYP76658.1 beta-galactosidase [Paenibacillus methanolicus]
MSRPAEIVAVDNGDLGGSEPYDRHWKHMHRGCVSTVLRFTGERGRVVLSAFGDGMHAAELVITIE